MDYEPKLSGRQRRWRYAGRKTLLGAIVALVAGGLIVADRAGLLGRAPQGDREKYDGKTFFVTHVVDGDTLDIDIPDGKHKHTRIRLWGVDTPETVKPNAPVEHFGPEASAFTKTMTLNQRVKVELEPTEHNRDKYNRLLAYVVLPDGRMLNRVLVEEGYAYADPRFPHKYKNEFKRLMNEAKNTFRGLWKDVRPDQLPYYYRDTLKLPAPKQAAATRAS